MKSGVRLRASKLYKCKIKEVLRSIPIREGVLKCKIIAL